MNNLRPALGIFGGTFDPVHYGHTQSVIMAAQQAGVQSVAMLPCHIPVHKNHAPSASQHRLAMLKLAIEQYPQLYIDEREYAAIRLHTPFTRCEHCVKSTQSTHYAFLSVWTPCIRC